MYSSSATYRRILVLAVISLSIAACDSGKISGEDSGETGGTHAPQPAVEFQVNDISVVVDSSGQLTEMAWHSVDGEANLAFQAGLWLAAVQDGTPRANLAWVGTYPPTNYAASWGGKRSGVFLFDPNNLREDDWPTEFGAPVDSDGNPHVFGDGMTWSVLGSRAVHEKTVLAQPLQNVLVRQSVYAYSNADLEDVLFVRYEIENQSESSLNDVYVGFHADTDLEYGKGFSADECESIALANRTAYDRFRALSYTYDYDRARDETLASNGTTSACPATVAGLTFLASPTGSSPDDVVTSHRIMRKNDYVDPDFGEKGMTSPEHVLNALKGLSNLGSPMVDPVTGEETMYAFTGNPMAGTGWLDVPGGIDVRSLLASGPFALGPGESEVLVVAISAQSGATLSTAVKSLKSQVDRLHGAPELWKFADLDQ